MQVMTSGEGDAAGTRDGNLAGSPGAPELNAVAAEQGSAAVDLTTAATPEAPVASVVPPEAVVPGQGPLTLPENPPEIAGGAPGAPLQPAKGEPPVNAPIEAAPIEPAMTTQEPPAPDLSAPAETPAPPAEVDTGDVAGAMGGNPGAHLGLENAVGDGVAAEPVVAEPEAGAVVAALPPVPEPAPGAPPVPPALETTPDATVETEETEEKQLRDEVDGLIAAAEHNTTRMKEAMDRLRKIRATKQTGTNPVEAPAGEK